MPYGRRRLFAALMAAFVFVWAAQLVALVVYEILIAAGFMSIEGVPQTKETLRY